MIEGGRRLSGTVRAAGNKNGALPILAATLLTSEPVTLTNVPRIRDVDTMLELLADVGADVAWTGANEVRVARGRHREARARPGALRADARVVPPRRAAARAARPRDRASARRRRDRPPPARPAHPRVRAAWARRSPSTIATRCAPTGASAARQIFLDEASVMATENTVMAAVLAPGETMIGNAACEPHVQDLCRFLVSLGAQIDGIESNVLRIHGVESLLGRRVADRARPHRGRRASSAWPR